VKWVGINVESSEVHRYTNTVLEVEHYMSCTMRIVSATFRGCEGMCTCKSHPYQVARAAFVSVVSHYPSEELPPETLPVGHACGCSSACVYVCVCVCWVCGGVCGGGGGGGCVGGGEGG